MSAFDPKALEDLIGRLRDEEDLCRSETAIDVANLLSEAAGTVERLKKAVEAAPQYRELLKEALPYVWIVRADPEAGKAAEAFAVKVMSALGIKEGETE